MFFFRYFKSIQCQNYYRFIQRYRCHANVSATSVTRFKTVVNRVTSSLQTSPQQAKHKRISADDICGSVRRLCKQGQLTEALQILHNVMDKKGIQMDSYTYASLLQASLNVKSITQVKILNAHLILTGFIADSFIGTKMVTVYVKLGFLADARHVFDEMPERNVVSWTAMLGGYARCGCGEEALTLFYRMQRLGLKPNEITFASILPACSNLGALERGKDIHEEIVRSGFQSDVFIGNSLIDMYAKCRSMDDARDVFDKMDNRNEASWNSLIAGYSHNGYVEEAWELFQSMPERNEVSWNAMISGYAQNGCFDESVKLFREMWQAGIKPNAVTFASVLQACASLAAIIKGKEVQGIIIRSGVQSNVFVGSSLVDMYAKCRSVEDARKVFDDMPIRNVVSWNAMIAGYAQNGHAGEAWKLFQQMTERNLVSWNAVISGFAQNQLLDDAEKLFQKMPEKDLVSWTVMISGYAQNGCFDKAVKMFLQMQGTGLKPNLETFTSLLPACANLGALHQGKEVHEDIMRRGLHFNIAVSNALIDMYAKCGCVWDAHKLFNKMPRQDIVSWTAIIMGYATHGYGKEALQLFGQMQNFDVKPDHITFVGVLCACCHAGLVDEGRKYFVSMSKDYHIRPSVEHYCCMVDLFGRAGLLDEAGDFIKNMPIKPDAVVWGCLLGACRVHNNIGLGEYAAKCLFELDPQNSSHYVALSNIYAMAGRWYDVGKVRKMMRERRIKKIPACSWIEVSNKVYTFFKGDGLHSQDKKFISN